MLTIYPHENSPKDEQIIQSIGLLIEKSNYAFALAKY